MKPITFIICEIVAIYLLVVCYNAGGVSLYFGCKLIGALIVFGLPFMFFGLGISEQKEYTKYCTGNGKTYTVKAHNEKEAIEKMVKLANK